MSELVYNNEAYMSGLYSASLALYPMSLLAEFLSQVFKKNHLKGMLV